jgi:arylsulfatase A
VIFLSDNGPQQPRYNSGLLERKGNPHEGGIRVPFLIRWPNHFQGGLQINTIAAHIDVTPTLLDLCGVPPPSAVKFDGVSLRPLLAQLA